MDIDEAAGKNVDRVGRMLLLLAVLPYAHMSKNGHPGGKNSPARAGKRSAEQDTTPRTCR